MLSYLQQPGVHQLTRAGAEIRDLDLPGFEVELGADEELERNRLRPELTPDLDADDVVMVEIVDIDHGLDLERVRQDARLEVEDGLLRIAFESLDRPAMTPTAPTAPAARS